MHAVGDACRGWCMPWVMHAVGEEVRGVAFARVRTRAEPYTLLVYPRARGVVRRGLRGDACARATLPAVLTYLLVTSCRTISGSSASGGCGTNMAPVSSVPFVTWESLDLRYSTCGEHAEQKGAHIVCTAARARAPPAHILTCACMCMRMCMCQMHAHVQDMPRL
jgi:hypothetical protein